jgi:hypothetical protein
VRVLRIALLLPAVTLPFLTACSLAVATVAVGGAALSVATTAVGVASDVAVGTAKGAAKVAGAVIDAADRSNKEKEDGPEAGIATASDRRSPDGTAAK